MIDVFDDFLSAEEHKEIYDVVSSSKFLWQWYPTTVSQNHQADSPVFYRMIEGNFDDDMYSEGVVWRKKIIDKLDINVTEVMRTRLNMSYPTLNPPPFNGIHKDAEVTGNFKSILYYLNDADGPTYFFNAVPQIVQPKANRLVMFDADIRHASSQPQTTDRRLVMNIVVRFE